LATDCILTEQAIDEKIRELSNCHIVYSGIDFQKVSCSFLFWNLFLSNIISLICAIDEPAVGEKTASLR
jgi:hypothetical protein